MDHIYQFLKTLQDVEFLATLVFFFVLFVIRYFLVRAVFGLRFKSVDAKRRWVSVSKNSSLIIIVLIFIMMWGKELQTLAFSLAAVAVALVIAFRELIMCVLQAIVRASTKQFEVGDRIDIAGHRGEVGDYNLLSTILFEIGPGTKSNQYTGRKIKVPNSLFLTSSLFIIPKGEHYTLQVMTVPAKLDEHVFKRQELLLKATEAVSAPYFTVATEYIETRCLKQGLSVPDLKPRALYEITDPHTVEFHVRAPMPFNRLTRTENAIKDMYLAECLKAKL